MLKLIKPDRLNWYKSIDNNLKAESTKLCKYVSSLRKHNSYAIHLDVNRTYVVELVGIGEVFQITSNRFIKLRRGRRRDWLSLRLIAQWYFQITPYFVLDISKPTRDLKPTKSVERNCIIGSSEKAISQYLHGGFNVPVHKQRNSSFFTNYRPIVILKHFVKFFNLLCKSIFIVVKKQI